MSKRARFWCCVYYIVLILIIILMASIFVWWLWLSPDYYAERMERLAKWGGSYGAAAGGLLLLLRNWVR